MLVIRRRLNEQWEEGVDLYSIFSVSACSNRTLWWPAPDECALAGEASCALQARN